MRLTQVTQADSEICLNPCFNGIWLMSKRLTLIENILTSLNPCFNGIWLMRDKKIDKVYDPAS